MKKKRVALLNEPRTTIQAEPVPITSFPGMPNFVTSLYGNQRINHFSTIGAMPYSCIGPPVVKVGTSIRLHYTVFLPCLHY